jgi:hypothetical protein
MEWRPISEATTDQPVLGGWYAGETWRWAPCRYDDHDGRWVGVRGGEPTHYLPLPQPPTDYLVPASAVPEPSQPASPSVAPTATVDWDGDEVNPAV